MSIAIHQKMTTCYRTPTAIHRGGAFKPVRYRNGTATETKVWQKEKGSEYAKPLNLLAPRPGLEPGTCGLTESQARGKLCIFNDLYQKNRFVR
jgi:hypothetical protein